MQPSRLKAIEPLAAIAVFASAMSAIMKLFDSGSDLTRSIVKQNRELLLENHELIKTLHDRFTHLGDAMEGVLRKGRQSTAGDTRGISERVG